MLEHLGFHIQMKQNEQQQKKSPQVISRTTYKNQFKTNLRLLCKTKFIRLKRKDKKKICDLYLDMDFIRQKYYKI